MFLVNILDLDKRLAAIACQAYDEADNLVSVCKVNLI